MPPQPFDPTYKPITYRQPCKGLYVCYQALQLLFLIPAWTIYYLIFPRPRPTWTLRESVDILIIRRLVEVITKCQPQPLASDKSKEVLQSSLRETEFVWLEPATRFAILRNEADDGLATPIHVPGYMWPKNADYVHSEGLFGIFFHGGGWGGAYTMGNGGESFSDSDIPRILHKHSKVNNILSVDYRLSSEACHPAQLIDALAAYAHVTGFWHIDPARIVVIGVCGGGHLALMLMRYLADEKVLPLPTAFMLFSPWIDMAIDQAQEVTPGQLRENTDVDVIATSYLSNLRFLGDRHPVSHLTCPYLSANLAPPGSYVGYPSTFIAVGDCETFHKEALQLADLMAKDRVDITLKVEVDAVHNFMARSVLPVPSAGAKARTREHALAWLDELVRKGGGGMRDRGAQDSERGNWVKQVPPKQTNTLNYE